MKRALYDLTDEEFAFFVNHFGEQMDKRNIPYALVGGTAVQAQILKRACTQTRKNVEQIILDPDIRLQNFIRATDDIDIVLDPSIIKKGPSFFSKEMREIFNGLQGEYISPSEEHIFEYHLMRMGMKRPVFQIYVDGDTDNEKIISMNLNKEESDLYILDPKHYQRQIDTSEEVCIPYDSNFNLNLRVINPSYLFAIKSSKFRSKDAMDLHVLADCMKKNRERINFKEIESILLPGHEREYERFLGLINFKSKK